MNKWIVVGCAVFSIVVGIGTAEISLYHMRKREEKKEREIIARTLNKSENREELSRIYWWD